MTKSKKIFVCFSVTSIASALLGTPLVALYLALSPKELAPYLLFPQKITNAYKNIFLKPYGVAGEKVNVPLANGGHLCGFYFPRPHAPYTVLISHGQGQMEQQIGLAHAALVSNLNVLIYDYEGYGESTGKATTSNLLNDGIAAYDYLIEKKKAKANQIIAMGSSMGTGIAANTALNRDCAALLLVAPYNSLAQAACDNINYFKLYPSFLFPQPDISCMPFMVKDKQRSDASAANAAVQTASSSAAQPVVIIHGALDQRIPVTHSRQLVAAYKETHPTKVQSSTQSKDDSNLRYVELPNYHHGDFSLNIITDELNGIVARLEASKKTLLSKK